MPPKKSAPAPDLVQLRSEDLGLTQDFTPAHAEALLAYQAERGYAHWVPVAEAATESK